MHRLIFFGTPEFAATILEGLIGDQRYNVCGVITQPDKPAGRKRVLTPSPVKTLAESFGIPICDFDSMIQIIESVRSLRPDLGVVAAYGKILPSPLLILPKFGCLNVHPSLLPKYRGASPIQTALLQGEKQTGITIIEMDEGMDTGPIVAQARVPIAPGETARTLTSKLATLGSNLLRKELPIFIVGKQGHGTSNPPRKQDNSEASYTKILRREDGKIDWSKTDEEIEQMIRAFDPSAGTWTTVGDLRRHRGASTIGQDSPDDLRRVKILEAHLGKGGNLAIDRLQIEGKNPVTWKEFQSGYLFPQP